MSCLDVFSVSSSLLGMLVFGCIYTSRVRASKMVRSVISFSRSSEFLSSPAAVPSHEEDLSALFLQAVLYFLSSGPVPFLLRHSTQKRKEESLLVAISPWASSLLFPPSSTSSSSHSPPFFLPSFSFFSFFLACFFFVSDFEFRKRRSVARSSLVRRRSEKTNQRRRRRNKRRQREGGGGAEEEEEGDRGRERERERRTEERRGKVLSRFSVLRQYTGTGLLVLFFFFSVLCFFVGLFGSFVFLSVLSCSLSHSVPVVVSSFFSSFQLRTCASE